MMISTAATKRRRGQKVEVNLPNRIREVRQSRGMSLSELADMTGFTRSELHKLEKGVRRLRTDHLPPLTSALKCSAEDILSPELLRQIVGGNASFLAGVANAEPVADLPLYGEAQEGGGLAISFNSEVDKAFRIPQLANTPKAYAIIMPDASMEPRVPVGATLYINPNLPARPGDLAVAIQSDGSSRVVEVARAPQGGLTGKTYTGNREFSVDTEAGIKVHRIVGIVFG